MEVVEEVLDDGEGFVALAAGGVGGDEAVGGCPEWVVWGEGFGVGDVEKGGGDFLRAEGGEERVVVDGGAAADVVEDGGGFHEGEAWG